MYHIFVRLSGAAIPSNHVREVARVYDVISAMRTVSAARLRYPGLDVWAASPMSYY